LVVLIDASPPDESPAGFFNPACMRLIPLEHRVFGIPAEITAKGTDHKSRQGRKEIAEGF
jgi:hypothetical protein